MITTVTAWLKHYRWFVLACIALAMNAGFWIAHRRSCLPAESGSPYAPVRLVAGQNGFVAGFDRIEWFFDFPPSHNLPIGEWHLNGPIEMLPETPGRFAWLAAGRLVFEPVVAWPAHTEYTVRLPAAWLPDGIASQDRFVSEPLRVMSVRNLALDTDRRASLQVQFSHPVAMKTNLSSFITLSTPDGLPVEYEIRFSQDGSSLVLQTVPVAAASLRVDIAKGLPPAQGTLGLATGGRYLLNLRESFSLQDAKAAAPAFESPRIALSFNQPVAEDLSAGILSVSPATPFSLERISPFSSFGRKPGSSLMLVGDFKPGQAYAIRLHETLCDVNGEPLQGTREVSVTIPDRAPGLRFSGAGIYLSRRGAAEVMVQSANISTIDIALEKLYANNLPYFVGRRDATRRRYYWSGGESRAISGLSRQVGAETRLPVGPRNSTLETPVRIPELAGDTGGVFLLTVRSGQQYQEQLVVLTDLAITARTAAEGGVIWVTSLRDGTPVPDVRLRILSAEHQPLASGSSDAAGMFRWQFQPSAAGPGTPALAIAETDDDMTFLSLAEGRLALPDETGGVPYPDGPYDAWLFSERNLFRPGDRLELAALVRDAALNPAPPVPVALRIIGIDAKPWQTLNGMLDSWGAVAFETLLPDHLRSGAYRAELLFPGQDTVLGDFGFRIQSFLPPRLRVSVSVPGETLRFPEKAHLRIKAEYLHGGVAAGLPLQSVVMFSTRDFMPAGLEAYRFSDEGRRFIPVRQPMGEWQLDNSGEIVLALPTADLKASPSMLIANLVATVTDSDGRATSAFAEVPVHRYTRYIGLKTIPGHVPVGQSLPLEALLVDTDGHIIHSADSIGIIIERITRTIRLERDTEGNSSYRSHETATVTKTKQFTLVDGRGRTVWTPDQTGEFRVTVVDSNGARASRRVRITEGRDYEGYPDLEQAHRVQLSLDDTVARYPGGRARLQVMAPFPGWALISVEGPGLHDVQVRRMENTAAVFDLRLPEQPRGHGVFAAVTVVRALQPGALPLPARAVGILRIPVERPAARLALEWELPTAPLRPGTHADVAVRVRDAAGEPAVGAQVWMLAVDEAITALGNYAPPDPLAGFLRNSRLEIRQADPFNLLLPEWEDAVPRRFESAPGGDMPVRGMNRLNPFQSRRYVPTAWWIGRFTTDAEGLATASLEWPMFDGRLRITAVAAHQQALGAITAERICRHPVVVRSGLPRFLSCGDQADIRIDIVNQDEQAQTIRLELVTRGPIESGGFGTGLGEEIPASDRSVTVHIPPHGRHSAMVPVRAGDVPGEAVWTLTARGEGFTVAETVELPVRPATPLETRLQAGRIAPGDRFEWQPADQWLSGTVTAELLLSGSSAARLEPLLRGLLEYPYGCLEQTVSQAFPLLYISDPAKLLPDAVLTPEGLKTIVQVAIQRILDMQRPDGGFAYWPSSRQTFDWGSVYAVHFLAQAARQGYEVQPAKLAAAVDVLYRAVLDQGGALDDSVSAVIQRANAAYACRAVAVAGRPARNWMRTLRERIELLDPESRLHLAAAYVEDGDRRTALEILEYIPQRDDPPVSVADAALLRSELRLHALRADTWRMQDPDHPRAVAARQRLLEELDRTGWYNTQEKAWTLMALSPLAGVSPGPVSLRILQGERVREENLKPGEIRRVGLDWAGTDQLTLHNTGTQPVWFQARESGYARSVSLASPEVAGHGLVVRRTWLDRNGHPLAQPLARVGDLLVVRLEVTARGHSIDHLVVEDLLPAGLEPEESPQVIETVLPWIKTANTMPTRHVEIRDDRVLVFPQQVQGQRAWHYAVRAVTPGTYRLAPIAAESMYDGDIRSRGVGAVFTVEP